ncbi:hypothetical protein KTT_51070 [Tengunoibacter tsumagoiensis]|uniref:NACHT domain-containing protein n=2 Tax=Tengunoibacter tsumagoiensis TaxID=2014871 RepID=A0A402A829_9CHLR|nr:hypothetical protein KTT_51070 [Tengunoibacter tsumagoiensis]
MEESEKNFLREELIGYFENMDTSFHFEDVFLPQLQLVVYNNFNVHNTSISREKRPVLHRAIGETDILRPNWLVASPFWISHLHWQLGYDMDYDNHFIDWKRELFEWQAIRSSCRRTVILSEAGGGKSWLLRADSAKTAREQFNRLEEGVALDHLVFPAMLQLGKLADELFENKNENTLYKVIASLLQRTHHFSTSMKNWVEYHLEKAPTIFLLDGLDTVSQERLPMLQRAFQQLDRLTHSHIIVTSRYDGYPGFPFTRQYYLANSMHVWEHAPLEEIELVGFTTEQIHTYIKRWFYEIPDQSDALLHQVSQKSWFYQFAKLPQHILWLCEAYFENPLHAVSREALYHYVVVRQLGRQIAMQPFLLNLFFSVLEQISWNMATQEGQWHYSISSSDLSTWVSGLLSTFPSEYQGSSDDIVQLVLNSGLLVKEEENDREERSGSSFYSWVALEVQCFFVARFLRKTERSTLLARINTYRTNTSAWTEVILLLALWIEDVFLLVNGLQAKDDDTPFVLFLRALCILETEHFANSMPSIHSLLQQLLYIVENNRGSEKRYAWALLLQLTKAPLQEMWIQKIFAPASHAAERSAALWVLPFFKDDVLKKPDLVDFIFEMALQKPESRKQQRDELTLRVAALHTLGALTCISAIPALCTLIFNESESDLIKCAAIWALGQLRDKQAIPFVVKMVHRKSGQRRHSVKVAVRAASAWALGELGRMSTSSSAQKALIETLCDAKEDEFVRATAIGALIQAGPSVMTHMMPIIVDSTYPRQTRCYALEIAKQVSAAWLWETDPTQMNFQFDDLTHLLSNRSAQSDIISTFIALVRNKKEDINIRSGAAEVLQKLEFPFISDLLRPIFLEEYKRVERYSRKHLLRDFIRILIATGEPSISLLLNEKYFEGGIAPGIADLDDINGIERVISIALDEKAKKQTRVEAIISISRILEKSKKMTFPSALWDQERNQKLYQRICSAVLPVIMDTDHSTDERSLFLLPLIENGESDVIDPLLPIFIDPNTAPQLRSNIAELLWRDKNKSRAVLLQALNDPNREIRISSLASLGKLADNSIVHELFQALEDNEIREYVIPILGKIKSNLSIQKLKELAQFSIESERLRAIYALSTLKDEDVTRQLIALLGDGALSEEYKGDRLYIISLLGVRVHKNASTALLRFLQGAIANDPVPTRQQREKGGGAALALGKMGSEEAIVDLLDALWTNADTGHVATGSALGLWVMGFSLMFNSIQDILFQFEDAKHEVEE